MHRQRICALLSSARALELNTGLIPSLGVGHFSSAAPQPEVAAHITEGGSYPAAAPLFKARINGNGAHPPLEFPLPATTLTQNQRKPSINEEQLSKQNLNGSRSICVNRSSTTTNPTINGRTAVTNGYPTAASDTSDYLSTYHHVVGPIQRAATCAQIASIIAEKGQDCSVREFSAALHKMGKIQQAAPDPRNPPHFMHVFDAAAVEFERFDPQGLSTAAWAAARFLWQPPPWQRHAWEAATISQLHAFNLSEAAASMFSLGKLYWRPRATITSAFVHLAVQRAEELEPRTVSSMLYGLARTRCNPGSELVHRLVELGVEHLGHPQTCSHTTSSVLFSLAVLKERPDDAILKPYIDSLLPQLHSTPGIRLAQVAWALGSLDCDFAAKDFWPALEHELITKSARLPAPAATQVFFGASRLGVTPSEEAITALLQVVRRDFKSLRTGDVGCLLHSLAMLNIQVADASPDRAGVGGGENSSRERLKEVLAKNKALHGSKQQHQALPLDTNLGGLNGHKMTPAAARILNKTQPTDTSNTESNSNTAPIDVLEPLAFFQTQAEASAAGLGPRSSALTSDLVATLLHHCVQRSKRDKQWASKVLRQLCSALWGAATIKAKLDKQLLDRYLDALDQVLDQTEYPLSSTDATMLLYAFDHSDYLPGYRFLKLHVSADDAEQLLHMKDNTGNGSGSGNVGKTKGKIVEESSSDSSEMESSGEEEEIAAVAAAGQHKRRLRFM